MQENTFLVQYRVFVQIQTFGFRLKKASSTVCVLNYLLNNSVSSSPSTLSLSFSSSSILNFVKNRDKQNSYMGESVVFINLSSGFKHFNVELVLERRSIVLDSDLIVFQKYPKNTFHVQFERNSVRFCG